MAMTLADVRAKYPQYATVDDQTLADALYKKYYPTADRREFDARVGLKPYDNMGQAALKGVQNFVPLWAQAEGGISQAVGESVNELANNALEGKNPGGVVIGHDKDGKPITATMVSNAPSAVVQTAVDMLPDAGKKAVAEWGAKEALTGALRAQQAGSQVQEIDAPALSPAGITGTVATSIPQMAPAMFASIALRNPTPALVGAYAQTYGQAYAQGRQLPEDWQKNFLNESTKLGLDPDQARQYAAMYGAAEAIPEMLPVGEILKEGGKLIPRILKAAASEGITEGITQAVQSALDKKFITPDMTWQQAWPQIVQAMAAGAITGGFFGIAGHQGDKALRPPADKPTPPPAPPPAAEQADDTPIEDRLALPAPQTLLALPSPDAFKPPEVGRRQPPAPVDAGIAAAVTPPAEDPDIAAREALQRTKQAETRALLDTARETVTPLGTFTLDEVGGPAAQRVRQRRVQLGRSVESPVSIAELADAKVPQPQIDALIAKRRPRTTEAALSPLDVQRTAESKNIRMDGNFAELARRTTGQSNVSRMTQAQLHALNTTLEAMPAHEAPVTVPIIDTPRFSDEQYGKAVDAVRKQGRYTAAAIRAATGLKSNQDVAAVRDAMVRRGQLVKHSDGDFRLYDVTGQERQTTPDDLPPGAFSNYVVARIPVSKVRIKVNGKSVGSFGSKTEARTKISEIRAAEAASNAARPAEVSLEPAADVAYGVMENRYDEQGNLLGQVVVDTHRNEADARAAADKLGTPDTGARYTQTAVEPTPAPPKPAPIRKVAPAGLVGRVQEVLDNLNALAKQRALPLLGVKVQLKTAVTTPEGDAVEGTYWKKLIQLTTEHLDPRMNTDEIVDRLAQVMDHELIHALRAAGLLGADTAGWKSLARYVMKAKRPGSRETYQQWADRVYSPIPGYETAESRVEEAIAEAFRYWARNRRAVSGQPATVFRQLVEWFKRLINSVPEDIFQSIESGELVRTALRPPGSSQPRAEATTKMEEAAKGVSEAQAAKDENLVRVRSREYLRARAQAREDRKGRSGPKTILGSTPTKTYETGKVMDRATVQGIVERFKEMAGVTAERLRTLLPIDTDFMKRVADAQQKALHMPQSDAVAKAYRALADETKAMFKALVHPDIQIEAWAKDGAPYKTASEITDDLVTGRLKIRPSNDMFGPSPDFPNHPMNAPSGFKTKDGRDLTLNDIFRVVHDIYGHGQSGFRDGPQGAYNAYHEHARLLSPLARHALATETLAQRAWQDFGQHLRRKDGTVPRPTDVDYLPDNKKEFAQQKAFLLDSELLAADPGLVRADAARTPPTEQPADVPLFSRFEDDLPGGRLYGNPKRSPGGVISKPDTPAPAFTADQPGNRFFAGPLADAQLEMAQLGVDGTTMIYLAPDDFLKLADTTDNPEQAVYDDAVRTGYKFSGMPSLVIDGYAGIVRAVKSDGTAMVRALRDMGERIPVVLYPRKKEGLGLVVAIEGRGERVETPRFSVGSEEFKRWFGDSKVVDKKGKPLVVYHGTNADINEFDAGRLGGKTKARTALLGFFFTENELIAGARFANGAGGNVMPVYLALQNPIELGVYTAAERQRATWDAYDALHNAIAKKSGKTSWNDVTDADIKAYRQLLIDLGYDGIILRKTAMDAVPKTIADPYSDHYIAFHPEQIKSAIGNVGTYDPTNPDIRYSLGERVLWPHDGRAENFPEKRGRLSIGSLEFRRWFGDSKVVNENGGPRVVYHGGPSGITAFDKSKIGSRYGLDTLGFFFTADGKSDMPDSAPTYAELIGGEVYPVFLRIERPLTLEMIASKLGTTVDGLVMYAGEPQSLVDVFDNNRDDITRLAGEGDYDGVILEHTQDDGYHQGVYVAFEPTQIKDAIANRGTWDATNPDIRYSMNAPVGTRLPTDPPDMRSVVHQRTEGLIGRFLKDLGRSKRSVLGLPSIFDARVKLQDKMLSWKEIEEYALEHGGKITDLNDVYMLEQLYHGKVFHELEGREKALQLPLLEAIKVAHDGPRKITPTDLEDYLYARHAAERNAYLRARGAPDENPSGMSDEEASNILDKFALDGKQPDLERLAAMVDAITTDTTRTRVEAGLITQEAADSSPYQHYVPLRGFADEELDPDNPTVNQTRARSGKGFSVGGREDRTVTGRKRKAGDLLGHVFLQNTEAVIRAQKNEVALAAMRLLQQNKDLGIGQVLKSAPTRRVVGANGMIHEAGDPSYRQREDIITAKWKGREVVAQLSDPRLARAIKSDYVTSSGLLVQALGRINRFLATVNTSLNPEFMVSNFLRDMQTAGILAGQYDIKGLGLKIIKSAPGAMAGIREVLRAGTANSDWAKAFRELQEQGGTTEFMGIHDLESKVRAIRNSITKTGWHTTARQAQEYAGKVFGFIEDYNKVVENALRLSAYKTARDAGISQAQAAYLAKNLTVNFNKGGEWKTAANAMYLFYNASVQGSFAIANGLKNKRVQRLVAGVTIAGVLMDIINRLISGDDDDNGVPDYDDIPDYVLETNMVIMTPWHDTKGHKTYLSIPMPYGFNAFYNLGRNLSAGFSGSPVRSPGKAAVDSLRTFADAYNPLGGAQSIWNFLAPTIADPVVDLLSNKDFSGKKIVPERFDRPGGVPVPDSQKYWSSTSEIPKYIAEQLNALTGGNDVRKGAIDVSPEVLQYGFDYVTGSFGKFIQRMTATGTDLVPKLVKGDFENVDVGEIPFARRALGSITNRNNTDRYYTVAQDVATVKDEVKFYSDAGRPDLARQTIAAHPLEARMIPLFDDIAKALTDLNKQEREVRANPNIAPDRRDEILKKLQEEQDRLMTIANQRYFAARAGQ